MSGKNSVIKDVKIKKNKLKEIYSVDGIKKNKTCLNQKQPLNLH